MSGLKHPVTSRFEAGQFLRFLLIGGTGALLYVALSTFALAVTALPLAVVSIGSHALLIPVMFYAQRSITFKSGGASAPEFLKYTLLQIACISTSTALLARLAGDDLRVNILVFTAIAAWSAILSFVICRLIIFSRPSAKPTESV